MAELVFLKVSAFCAIANLAADSALHCALQREKCKDELEYNRVVFCFIHLVLICARKIVQRRKWGNMLQSNFYVGERVVFGLFLKVKYCPF